MAKDMLSIARSTKYPLDAFAFVQRGLEFTVRRIHGESGTEVDPVQRHVTGRDLSAGLRDYAIDQYGLLARMVLRRWNIISTEDFGAIVFAMVDVGMLHKTDEDSPVDFANVFDFATAFPQTLELSNDVPAVAPSGVIIKETKPKSPKKK